MELSEIRFVWLAIACLFIIILILLYLCIRNRKAYNDEKIKTIIYASMESGRIGHLVDEKIKAELSHRKLGEPAVATVVPKETLEHNTKPVEITEEAKAEIEEDSKSLPTPITLFASVCIDGKFKRIESTPNDRSIYIISAADQDSVEGIISIDRNAYEKVANTPDYLNDACVVSGSGPNVKEVHAGSVVKTDGQWIIKEPIEVELY